MLGKGGREVGMAITPGMPFADAHQWIWAPLPNVYLAFWTSCYHCWTELVSKKLF